MTRHGYATGMNDVDFDPLTTQPAGQPEAVTTGLEGDGNAGNC